ncbi:MAG: hypothetical protein AAFV72_23515 [Cyanobacteria bacterium J06635_1]
MTQNPATQKPGHGPSFWVAGFRARILADSRILGKAGSARCSVVRVMIPFAWPRDRVHDDGRPD